MKWLLTTVLALAFSTAGLAERLKGTKTPGRDQTTMDFEDTLIEGQMKAPNGFFIQGEKKQGTINQMVKLKTNFKPNIKSSQYRVLRTVK